MKMCISIFQNRFTARVNLLWPFINATYAIITWLKLVQVTACCFTVPCHYLNQYWLMIIREVLWHSNECSLTGNAQDIYHWYEFENCSIEYYSHISQSVISQWSRVVLSPIFFNYTITTKPMKLSPCGLLTPYCDIDLTNNNGPAMAFCPAAPSHYPNQCWSDNSAIFH